MSALSFHGIIPARYGSTRFHAKALADIDGKPMFWHVYTRALASSQLTSLHLATDDERIASVARELDVPVIMTSKDHVSGTNRVYEAAQQLQLPDSAIVFNIQGDEAGLEAHVLDEMAQAFSDPAVKVATPATRLFEDDVNNPNRVKVVRALNGDALYFSRSAIPYARHGSPDYFLHIGLYAFSMRTLAAFTAWPQSSLEIAEQLEQLRFLENGVPIRVVLTNYYGLGIDTPEDLILLKELKARNAAR